MTPDRSPRAAVRRVSRRTWTNLGLLAVLAVAVAVSFVSDPSPLAAWVLGVALLVLVALRTLLAMGLGPGRRR